MWPCVTRWVGHDSYKVIEPISFRLQQCSFTTTQLLTGNRQFLHCASGLIVLVSKILRVSSRFVRTLFYRRNQNDLPFSIAGWIWKIWYEYSFIHFCLMISFVFLWLKMKWKLFEGLINCVKLNKLKFTSEIRNWFLVILKSQSASSSDTL